MPPSGSWRREREAASRKSPSADGPNWKTNEVDKSSSFIDHPGGEAFEKVLETLKMLWRELVLYVGILECFVETAKPNLPRWFIDLER